MKKMIKRTLAVVLTLTMCIGLLNLTTFAAEERGRYCVDCTKYEVYYVDQVDPTCETEGVIAHYACRNCSSNYYLSALSTLIRYAGKVPRLEKLGHNLTHYDAVEATCTEDGNIEYWSCTNCGEYFLDKAATQTVDDVTTSALGHYWTVETKDATCKEAGEKTSTCSVCGKSETEVIPTIEHDYSEWQYTDWVDVVDVDGVVRIQCREGIRICNVCNDEQHTNYQNPVAGTVVEKNKDQVTLTVHYLDDEENEFADSTVEALLLPGQTYTTTVKQFDGWTTTATAETVTMGDEAKVIVYRYTAIEYPVYWVNWDSTALANSTYTVKTGVPAADTYAGETPARVADVNAVYTYRFTGWSEGSTDIATGAVTYTAQYDTVDKNQVVLTIRYQDDEGNEFAGSTVEEFLYPGQTYTTTVKQFDGWTTTAVAETVTMDDETKEIVYHYTAIEYPVYWVNWNGTALAESTYTVKTGVPAADAYAGAAPTRAADAAYTYQFSGWLRGENSSGAVTYTAQYNSTPISVPDPVIPTPTPTPTPVTPDPVEIEEEEPPLAELPEELFDIEDEEPPLAELPEELFDIEEEEPPLAELPEELFVIEDGDVPLANVPKTGDSSLLWVLLTTISGAGLAWLALDKKRGSAAK